MNTKITKHTFLLVIFIFTAVPHLQAGEFLTSEQINEILGV